MTNIDSRMMSYLEAKRHVWNTYFVGIVDDLRECHPLEFFEEIDRNLFLALVCYPLEINVEDYFKLGNTVHKIIVKPREGSEEISMMISNPIEGMNRSWNIKESFQARGIELSFIEFFEWDNYGYISCAKTRCKILKFDQNPNYVDREVLVENYKINFFLKD